MTEIIAFCGLACHECPAFIATQENDDSKRAEVARYWSELFGSEIKAGDINCDGCHTTNGRIFGHCQVCEIRKCGQENKLENCGQCNDYFCEKLTEVFNWKPDAKITLDKINSSFQN